MVATIHNVDQRSPVVRFEHKALGTRPVECVQHVAGTDGFQANTSSVIWACGPLLAQHLCDTPELVAGKRCIELGAGIGLTGAVAARLGAESVLTTDIPEAMPLLQANAQRTDATLGRPGSLRAHELLWGEPSHIDACGRRAHDVVLGADILYHQSGDDVAKLVETMSSLLSPGGVVLLAYEWRQDWETTDAFHEECDARGLTVAQSQLADCDEDDCVLFTLARGEIASSRGAAPRPAGGPGGGAAAPAREGEATDDGEAAYTFFSQE